MAIKMRKFQDDEEEDPNDSSSMLQDSLDAGASVDDSTTDDPNVDEPDSTPDETESPVPSRQSSRFADIFNQAQALPEGKANARYREFLDAGMPPEQKPGKLNRLAAILGGVSEGYFHGAGKGFDTQDKILNAPHDREIKDFANKAKVLNAAAGQEDKVDQNRNRFARTAIASLKDEDTATNKAKELKIKEDNAVVDRAYKNARVVKMQHPDLKFHIADGRLLGIDPSDTDPSNAIDFGDAHVLGKSALDQKKELERFNQGQIQAREVNLENLRSGHQDARQAAGIEATGARQDKTLAAAEQRQQTGIDAKNAQPGVVHAGRLEKLRAAIADPENLKQVKEAGLNISDFVEYKRDTQGNKTMVGIKFPTGMFRDAAKDKKVFDGLHKEMYGE